MLASSSAHDPVPAYGNLWWIDGKARCRTPGPYLLPANAGPLVPSAPSDMVAASGADDEKIYVVPSHDLVVVRHGRRSNVAAASSLLAVTRCDEELRGRLRRRLRLALRDRGDPGRGNPFRGPGIQARRRATSPRWRRCLTIRPA